MKDFLLLATVNAKKSLYGSTAAELSSITPNVHLGLLTAYARSRGLAVRAVDSEVQGLSTVELSAILERERPRLVGFICTGDNPSSSTMVMAGIVDFFRRFPPSRSGVTTFIWGPHPTVLPRRSLEETGADFVVRGEGFQTIVDLYRAIVNGRKTEDIPGLAFFADRAGAKSPGFVRTPDVPLIRDLDSLPPIDWKDASPTRARAHNWHCLSDLDRRSPYAVLWTSFGCPFHCAYCCINNLYGRREQRFRNIDGVIREIRLLVERYGVRNIRILDELFVAGGPRINEFCDRLGAEGFDLNMWCHSRLDTVDRPLLKKLKSVGMNWISYGFEAASIRTLERVRKAVKRDPGAVIAMTRDEGLNICADVMFGMPGEDAGDMRSTFDFLLEHNFEWVNMYPFFKLPGTELFREDSAPDSWSEYSLYGYHCKPAGTEFLSPAEVLRFRDRAFEEYYTNPEYLKMIESKFGPAAADHIRTMTAVRLRRRLLGD